MSRERSGGKVGDLVDKLPPAHAGAFPRVDKVVDCPQATTLGMHPWEAFKRSYQRIHIAYG